MASAKEHSEVRRVFNGYRRAPWRALGRHNSGRHYYRPKMVRRKSTFSWGGIFHEIGATSREGHIPKPLDMGVS
jgi:hypothetical protein